MTTLLRLLLLPCLVLAVNLPLLAAPPKSKERPYTQGPLKVDEFLGEAPPEKSATAHTATRIRYEFQFLFGQNGQQVTVSVRSIKLRVVFLPEESWYGPDTSPDLLDHEQGHFDIAEINAHRVELALEQARLAGKLISATGNSRQSAHAAVMVKLDEIAQLADKKTADDNVEYDRNTRHGFNFSEQSELRKIQKLTLQSLTDELEQLNPRRKRDASRSRQLKAD